MDTEVLSHYYVLEVEHDARDVQIKLGYHRQSRRWHPDRNYGVSPDILAICTHMMQRLNDAITCLRDPEARRTYELRCASMVFTHEDDPGNYFRRQFEAERRAREEAAQRRRTEERERNAARQREREDQERRRREAEERERQRREAEARERRQRAEREQQAAEERERAEQEQQERERRRREQREQEQNQGRRPGAQEHQSRTSEPNRSTNSEFAGPEWENFFNILRILILLHELASENRQTRPDSSSTPSSGSTASSDGASRPSAPNAPPEAPQSTQEQPDDTFAAGSTESPNSSNQRRRQSAFGDLPRHSSRARWSDAELEALLKLRRDYPYDRWDDIAIRLNAMFGNGRNGNAVRLKHSKSTR
ncbi:hypothetical protein TWF281_011585 [Arthrobotrys megalospora]